MGLFSPGKMRFFSPRKKKAVLEEEEPVSASPLGDASTHAAYAAYESSFPRRDRRDIAPVVLHVAVASPAPPSPARAEAGLANVMRMVVDAPVRHLTIESVSRISVDRPVPMPANGSPPLREIAAAARASAGGALAAEDVAHRAGVRSHVAREVPGGAQHIFEQPVVRARGHAVDAVVRAHDALGTALDHRLLERGEVGGEEVVLRDGRVEGVPVEQTVRAPGALERVGVEVLESDEPLQEVRRLRMKLEA